MRLAGLQGGASLDPALPPANLPGAIGCTPDPGPGPGGLFGSIVPLAGVLAQLRPRDGTVQHVLVRLTASLPTGDVVFELSDLAGGFSWDEALDEHSAFEFAVPASAGDWRRGPLGYETTWAAPPPGLAPLRLEVVYVTAAGAEAVYALITNGIAQASRRSLSREGHLLEISALGPWGRYDRAPVTLNLPPRHGLTHGALARQAALQAGVPPLSVAVDPSLGAPRMRALDVAREQLDSLLRELGESLVYAFDFDRDARLVAYDLVPAGAPAEWVFTLDQIAADSELGVDADGEVVTCVTVTGTAPERPDSGLGAVTTVEIVYTFSADDYSIPGAYWRQQPDLTLAAGGGPAFAGRTLIGIVETRRTKIGGCLHEEQVITSGMMAPEVARYTIAADGTLGPGWNSAYLYEAGAVASDSTKAYAWQRHRLVEISNVVTRYHYGLASEEQVRTEIFRHAWFNRPVAIKQRDNPASPWEDEPYIDGTFLTGDGGGVLELSESYFDGWTVVGTALQFARSTEFTDHHSSDGKLLKEDIDKRDWLAPDGGVPGEEYLYKDGHVSRFPAAIGMTTERVEKVYSAPLTGGLVTIETKFRDDGSFGGQTITRGDGDRPATPRCDEADEDRKSGRPFEVTVCAGEGSHVRNGQDFSSDFIESEAEARAWAARFLCRAQALTCTLKVPVNAALQRGMPIRIYIPEMGLDHEGWIERHRIEKGAREASLLSEVTLRLRTF